MKEMDPDRLRKLAARARRLADGIRDGLTQQRLLAAAAEYEQRAKEIEMDDTTGH